MINAAVLRQAPKWTGIGKRSDSGRSSGRHFTTLTELEANPQWIEVQLANPEEEQGGTYSVAFPQAQSSWRVREALNAINQVITLEEGWDSYGGQSTTIQAVLRALDFMNGILTSEAPMPQITAVPDGGLQLEWHTPGRDLEVEFRPEEGAYVYYWDESRDEEWTKPLDAVMSDLNTFLFQFRQH